MIQTYTIEKCKICGEEHSFQIDVEKKVPIFGGASLQESSGKKAEWTFVCPNTGNVFSTRVELPKGLVMKGVAEGVVEERPAQVGSDNEPAKSEYKTWVKDSRDRALSFSTTMLTTSTGSIGILFAILKYLGVEKIADNRYSIYAFIPSIFYLLASLFFILALMPKFANIAPSSFEEFRANVLKRINVHNKLGLYAFLAGNVTAVISFLFVINNFKF